MKNPELCSTNENRIRRKTLEDLACNLISLCINERIRNASINKYSGLDSEILFCFEKLGFKLNKVSNPNRNEGPSGAKTRRICSDIGCKGNQNKHSNYCNTCNNCFCSKHCEKITTIICNNCIEK